MFKQDEIRIFPEDIEKQVIKAGAELVLCQQVGNRCVIHYTGEIVDMDQLNNSLSYVPRLRFKQVDEIKLDDNLRKIIRTQTF
jgi:predicted peroxiredoxin